MTSQQLTSEALALPISERISLAQTLWQSIGNADPVDSLREAIRRDQELSSKAVVGRTHEEVMNAARRAI